MSYYIEIGCVDTEFGRLTVHAGRYTNGGAIAIELATTGDFPEPFCTLSVNFPGLTLAPTDFYVKTWSENEGIIGPLLRCGLFEDSGVRKDIGFGGVAPIWRLKDLAHVPAPLPERGKRRGARSAS